MYTKTNKRFINLHKSGIQKRAFLLTGMITAIFIISLISLVIHYKAASAGTHAYIYQDGVLIKTINLTNAAQTYSFDITGEHGSYNTIEVRNGKIGITAASCSDSLCMKMGFIHNNRIPVTCLPNKLVIKVVSEEKKINHPEADIITY